MLLGVTASSHHLRTLYIIYEVSISKWWLRLQREICMLPMSSIKTTLCVNHHSLSALLFQRTLCDERVVKGTESQLLTAVVQNWRAHNWENFTNFSLQLYHWTLSLETESSVYSQQVQPRKWHASMFNMDRPQGQRTPWVLSFLSIFMNLTVLGNTLSFTVCYRRLTQSPPTYRVTPSEQILKKKKKRTAMPAWKNTFPDIGPILLP